MTKDSLIKLSNDFKDECQMSGDVSMPGLVFNTYSMKQPDLHYFETIKMTSQALSNFVWRTRAAGEYSL